MFFRGFGLHAGKAVQGAIGSPRKLDATYISESVERAEFLESSTKTYGKLAKLFLYFEKSVGDSNSSSPSFNLRCPIIDV